MIVATAARAATAGVLPHRHLRKERAMGIKKISKRLAKVGRKASESLGEGGKKWVEAVFETAIGVIEDELRKKVELGKKAAKPAKTAAASPGVPPRRRAAPAARKAAVAPRKKGAKPAKKE